MSDATVYYRHSGRFAPLSLLSMMGIAVIVGVIGGFAYGAIVYYMPIIYINALICIGLGIGVGALVRRLAIHFHIRNLQVVALTGVVAGLAAEYAAFVGWLAAIVKWQVFVVDPRELLSVLQIIGEEGVWSMSKSSDPVTGLMLYSIWAIEAGTIVIGAAVTSVANLRATPYCEECRQWLTDMIAIGPLEPIADSTRMRAKLERGEFSVLGDVKPLREGSTDGRFAQFELRDCPTCDDFAVMTVRNVQVVVDKEGKASTSSKSIVENLLIDRASSQMIRDLMPHGDAATKPAATSEASASDAEPTP